MQIMNVTKNKLLVSELRVADTFLSRLKGLLGKAGLQPGEGLLIRPCNSVHTIGMRFTIDIIFADANHRVVKTVSDLGPGKATMCRPGCYVVELPAGVLAATGTVVGDYLSQID